MKRLLIILFVSALSLALLLFIGCGSPSNGSGQSDAKQDGTEDETPDENQPNDGEQADDETKEITEMYLTVGNDKLEVTLEKNPSVDELIELLKQGDIVFNAEENGGFELYGDIGHTLSADDSQITAQAGDVILYSRKYLCIFFGSNSWSYTRIGKINGYSPSELRNILGGKGSVQITLSLK